MKKLKIFIILFCILGLILSLPSIAYLISNKTIENYNGQNYYFIGNDEFISSISGSIIFGAILILGFILYFKTLKKSSEFKNIKNVILVVALISLVFALCLPNTTTDIFYYMGTGRLFQHYGENPYYTTITNILETGISDSILEHSGVWQSTVIPYGPIWAIICAIFSMFSFGIDTIFLYVFKIASVLIHIGCCYLVYKITKRKKFALMYGLNPFLLLEFLVNVHNDLYLVFFVLLGIYFLREKKNVWLALVALSLSVLVKYVTIILAPFFVLYHLRDKKIVKKILWCILYAIFMLAIVLGVYLLFFDSLIDLLEILTTQQGRIMNSIYLLLNSYGASNETYNWVKEIALCAFIYLIVLYMIIVAFFNEKEKWSYYMKYVKNLFLIIIFGILTNLTSWYLSWLFIPIYWLNSKSMKRIFCMQFCYEFVYIYWFFVHSDATRYQTIVIPAIVIGLLGLEIISNFKNNRRNKLCKKTMNM